MSNKGLKFTFINRNSLKAVFILIAIFIGYSAFSIITFKDKVQLVKTDMAIVLGAAAWDEKKI